MTTNDDDLKDLLQDGKDGGKSQMAPLNVESSSSVATVQKHRSSFASMLCFYFAYACEWAPKTCSFLACLGIFLPLYFIIQALMNPTEAIGNIAIDFSNFNDNSQYTAALGKIDHWCIQGDSNSCRCEDPLEPQPKLEFPPWVNAYKANKKRVNEAITSATDVDVAFLGESVIEEMGGQWLGKSFKMTDGQDGPNQFAKLFQRNFDKTKGGKVQGITLGVAGDTSASVLWRLQNGLLVDGFSPKVWWLQLGLNDIGRMQCSEEVVVLGILRIVEEILEHRSDTQIVINSLLPMADFRRSGPVVSMEGYKDAQGIIPKEVRIKQERVGALRGGETRNKPSPGGRKKDKPSAGDDGIRRRLHLSSNFASIGQTHQRQLGVFQKREYAKEKHVKTKKDGDVIMHSDQHKTKKYRPGIVRGERVFPLWTSITAINTELRKFCEKHPTVTFFDATKIFATKESQSDKWLLNRSMITVRGHPTLPGYSAWENQISNRVQKLLAEDP